MLAPRSSGEPGQPHEPSRPPWAARPARPAADGGPPSAARPYRPEAAAPLQRPQGSPPGRREAPQRRAGRVDRAQAARWAQRSARDRPGAPALMGRRATALAGSSFRRRRRRLCGHAIPSTASTSASRRRGTGRRRRQSDYSTTLIAPPPAAAAPWMRDPGRRPAREPGRRGRTSGRLPRSASARYLPVPMQPRPR
jgi:hypothetical protein